MAYYAVINGVTNICENVTSDDRPINEVILPAPYFVVDLINTTATDWIWDEQLSDWVQVEHVGNGGIGDIWDGQKLNQPRPD